jgi:hypothetical protein
MSDNGFLIRGEFEFPVYDFELPDGATQQQAMDLIRRRIENADGRVLTREESEIERLRARVSALEHYVVKTARRLGIDNPAGIVEDFDLERVGEASLAEIERMQQVTA